MLIYVKKATKNLSKNRVFLIQKYSELKAQDFSKNELNYFKKELENESFVSANEAGRCTFICKFGKIKEYGVKESIRKFGSQVFEASKNGCTDLNIIGNDGESIALFAEGFSLSSYAFDKYLSKDRKAKQKLKNVTTSNSKVAIAEVNKIVGATIWARDLVNEPLSYLTATQLSIEIKEKCTPLGIKVEVFGKQKIESLKMGGLLAVNKGSIDPPTFTILEWKPKNAVNSKPIVLVGKGIVYDTGGVSLKPTAHSMDFMKSDMGGAAAVLGATLAAAELNLPIHIITLIPATDNRPGGNAYVPGDIITMFDGTTVEVLNTDAEGRMVLADALSYAKKYKPELVIDAATLTGAAARAIGPHAIVAMGNAKQSEFKKLNAAGMAAHDRIVQFPFWDDYFEEMNSPIADLNNLGGPFAGMITAGKFLEHFTDYPYIHLDVAGPAFLHKDDSYRKKGGTGTGVRLLTEFFKIKASNGKK
ncbi:leucyl aminopeptidase family protein [Crocinitomix sp.]|nr:leucyl aminopeptidase family protein [Crocinitomix sp.]